MTKQNSNIFSPLFQALKNNRSRSRISASEVKEKCLGGQGEVRRGSRRNASGVKEKCVDFFCFSAEYHTFIWTLKGPKIKQNIFMISYQCKDFLSEEIILKSWVTTSALALMHWRNVKKLLSTRTFLHNYLRIFVIYFLNFFLFR